MASSTPSPESITAEAFGALLARYPAVIADVSKAKGAKPGQKTLAKLDEFRYTDAPSMFGRTGGKRAMNKQDVLSLVEWKLRHGKFRPTLMKLVEANDATAVETTIERAMKEYCSTVAAAADDRGKKLAGHVEAALAAVKVLSTMRGIGPATASLLAAVHCPDECIFFSDEAYAWLVGGGPLYSQPQKYNMQEYESVARAMVQLRRRLPVEYGAQDIEQVAYVLMYDRKTQPASAAPPAAATTATVKNVAKGAAARAKAPTSKAVKEAKSTQAKQSQESRKRKERPAETDEASSKNVRRSSRHKSSS